MLYLRKCLFALFTPWGRLSAAPFAVMTTLVIAAHCGIQMHITSLGEDLPPYNAWSMSLFVLMWISFCITSRRFHDGAQTAFWLVPLLVVTFASYLAVLDNLPLASSVFEEDRDALRWCERGRFALQILGLVAMVAAVARQGDVGDNIFGPEFYTPNAKGAAKSARVQAQVDPVQGQRRPARVAPTAVAAAPRQPQNFLANGPRGRITPGESTRGRADGFGRR
jgi:uncharacterized membrane protein YhaH (DUF805 family)